MSLINREALMKELGIGMDCSVCEHNETPYCIWKPNVVDICEAITNAPTIEPEPKWIPVSERLPEEKQDVLLAFKHNMVVGFWEDILNDGGQAWYANSGNGWMTGTETVDDDGYPIAWMPLPEPYREEGGN